MVNILITVAVVVVCIVLAILVMNKPKLKIPAQVLLVVAIIFLAFMVYDSIMAPVRFEREFNNRRDVVIERLKDIRDAQFAYKEVNKKYTSDFDSLIVFLKTGELPKVKKINNTPDALIDSLTEQQQIARGYLIMDTTKIKVLDSLYTNRENFNVDDIQYIPFSKPKKKFELNATEIERSHIMVPVFEASTHFNDFLNDLDKQLLESAIDNREKSFKYAGWKVGSVAEPSTDGNWE